MDEIFKGIPGRMEGFSGSTPPRILTYFFKNSFGNSHWNSSENIFRDFPGHFFENSSEILNRKTLDNYVFTKLPVFMDIYDFVISLKKFSGNVSKNCHNSFITAFVYNNFG